MIWMYTSAIGLACTTHMISTSTTPSLSYQFCSISISGGSVIKDTQNQTQMTSNKSTEYIEYLLKTSLNTTTLSF